MNIENVAREVLELVKSKCKETEKDSLRATLVDEQPAITDSCIEGLPYLPIGAQIPEDKEGRMLSLLAQINFDECPKLQGFPEQGMLQFWVLNGEGFGIASSVEGSYKVVYYDTIKENYHSEDELKNIYNPYKESERIAFLVAPKPLKMKLELQKQHTHYIDFVYENAKSLFEEISSQIEDEHKDEVIDEVCELIEKNEDWKAGTRLRGYASFTQEDPRQYYEIAEYDTLLFQIDSEAREGSNKWKVMIGDCGIINFFINKDKLKALDFSDIYYTWDCY